MINTKQKRTQGICYNNYFAKKPLVRYLDYKNASGMITTPQKRLIRYLPRKNKEYLGTITATEKTSGMITTPWKKPLVR